MNLPFIPVRTAAIPDWFATSSLEVAALGGAVRYEYGLLPVTRVTLLHPDAGTIVFGRAATGAWPAARLMMPMLGAVTTMVARTLAGFIGDVPSRAS